MTNFTTYEVLAKTYLHVFAYTFHINGKNIKKKHTKKTKVE